MFVRDWMSAPAVIIPPVVPAEAALGFMQKSQIRRLPVVEDGRLIGIVTRSDLEAAIGKEKVSLRRAGRTVADVMTADPFAVSQEDTLEAAASLMLENKISGLPVVDEGRVTGILTESDLFRALCAMLGIGEKGARVVLNVKDDANLLQTLGKRLNGLALRSLVTVHDARRGRWDVVLRVRGRTRPN